MTDATILIPTHRHAALLRYAVASALDQEDASVEVFVVGDGVEDDTREVVAQHADDPRLRFFDRPKGPRRGELLRHEALQEASGRIVCYLSDDDLLLPGHAAEMRRLLEHADFAHPPQTWIDLDGTLHCYPFNYGRADHREIARGSPGSIGLTGASHTLEAYRRLPFGWRTTPDALPTDHYMWRQWIELPGFRAVRGDRLTYLSFPDPTWGSLAEDERAGALAEWFERSRRPGFQEELDGLLAGAVWRAAEDLVAVTRGLKLAEEALRSTRTWRLRERLLRLSPVRTLLARRPRTG
jgi:glycosyltransferase involved in cell wall biosynthesis